MFAKKQTIHHYIHILLLCFLAVSVSISNFCMSVATIALVANWVFSLHFKEKFANKQNNRILFSVLVLYVVHLVWLFNTSNFDYALHDLRAKLPLLILPIVFFTSATPSKKEQTFIFSFYIATVFIGTFVGFYNSFYVTELNYREIIPFISHIRFGLNVCFVIFILSTHLKSAFVKHKNLFLITFAGILWLLYFLVLLQSYTCLLICLVTLFFLMLRQLFIVKKTKKWLLVSTCLVLLLATSSVFYYYYTDFYTLKVLSTGELKKYTAKGNPYTHSTDFRIEDGNYIDNYVCHQELMEEWGKRSTLDFYESTKAKTGVEKTLIRYLNSKQLTKDAEGINQLSENDIHNIENGISNVNYASYFGIKKMFSRFFAQCESYRLNGDVKGSSIMQRVELWKTGFEIIKHNLWFGVGTGDVPNVIKAQLNANNSQLKDTNIRCHNQYITFVLTFGIIGFAIILISFVYVLYATHALKDTLFFIFLIIALLSMVSEDTLETQAGVTFFAFFFNFFLSRLSQRKYVEICKLET